MTLMQVNAPECRFPDEIFAPVFVKFILVLLNAWTAFNSASELNYDQFEINPPTHYIVAVMVW